MPYVYAYLFLLSYVCCLFIAYSIKENAADAKAYRHRESDPFSSKNYPTIKECGLTDEEVFGDHDQHDKPSK